MVHEQPYALSTFELANDSATNPSDVETKSHPRLAHLKSPIDAAEFLAQGGGPSLKTAFSAADATRCAWLTGGATPTDPFVLNWKGPLASTYDWVALEYKRGSVGIVVARWYSPSGWQWAERGSPFVTGYTPLDISNAGGSSPSAGYYVWDSGSGQYWGQPSCIG